MIDFMIVVLIAAVVLTIMYILSLRGRKGHPGLESLRGWSYAHRGLYNESRPENSMSAFRAALEGGYGIELDVHLMKDGNLAVIHDSSLLRTAGIDIKIEELTLADLEKYHLDGTTERIPLFRDVLRLFDGKAPLIVELKPAATNHDALCKAVCEMLEDYQGVYCVESFDPRCVVWFRKHRPHVIRGQLSENYFKSVTPLPWILKFILTNQIENFLVLPDFVAYRCTDRINLGTFLVRKLWGVQGVTWTLQSKEDYDAAVKDGWIPIFEHFKP